MHMVLKPQDIFISLKLVAIGNQPWTYVRLANELFMSASEINAGVKRSVRAGLIIGQVFEELQIPVKNPGKKAERSHMHWPNRKALEEFLIHGVKYAFPPDLGEPTRGLPTSYGAVPIKGKIVSQDDMPPVWPYPEGEKRGYSFSPLYPSVPKAALADSKLYELLVLVDAIRDSRAREANIAIQELRKRLKDYGKS